MYTRIVSVCGLDLMRVQAGMFAIRARRKVASERDFLDAVEKVVRQGTKFSSTYVISICKSM
jgi:ATP-dependent 26S proteasome regulatory subunit